VTKAALILFITRLNATAVIEKAAEVLTAHPACTDSLASENPSRPITRLAHQGDRCSPLAEASPKAPASP
jgi:hypothetical protein